MPLKRLVAEGIIDLGSRIEIRTDFTLLLFNSIKNIFEMLACRARTRHGVIQTLYILPLLKGLPAKFSAEVEGIFTDLLMSKPITINDRTYIDLTKNASACFVARVAPMWNRLPVGR